MPYQEHLRRYVSVRAVFEEVHGEVAFRRVGVDDDSDDLRDAETGDDQLADDGMGITVVTPASREHFAQNGSGKDLKLNWTETANQPR